MVLYKRKQVLVVLAREPPEDENTEVWVIPQTKEWFTKYEDYLERMDYYMKRKFVCEITGNSCLTFFEAFASEVKEIKDVAKNFPESLKGHILRFLQFNRITRLDQLVDRVYLQFKNNYFPGEYVFIKGIYYGTNANEISAFKERGIIREKVEYNNSHAVYSVVRLSDGSHANTTADKITRDRNHFTKWLIKTFIKLTMTRSHKIGAPWVVKNKYARKYRIDQTYPPDLQQYEATTAIYDDDLDLNRMRHVSVFTQSSGSTENSPGVSFFESKKRPFSRVATPKTSQSKKPTVASLLDDAKLNLSDLKSGKKFPIHYLPEHLKLFSKFSDEGINGNKPGTIASMQNLGIPPTRKNMVDDLNIKFDLQNTKPVSYKLKLPDNARIWNEILLRKLAEKHDDDEEEELWGVEKERLSHDHVVAVEKALETWVFINIYHSVLKIDTFTFDDFVYSMGWNHLQFNDIGRCELLDEIWCSVLGAIVSNRNPTKSEAKASRESDDVFGLQVILPTNYSLIKKDNDDEVINGSESDFETNNKSMSDDDMDSDDNKAPSKIKKEETVEPYDADDEEDKEEDDDERSYVEAEDESEDENTEHKAFQMMNHRGLQWQERLRKRNFKDGNWQTILLGVLSLVEDIPKYEATVKAVFKVLAPPQSSPTPGTALDNFYRKMDIDLRFDALAILCELLATSDLVRDYIDENLDESTNLRRDRLENIKEYKTIYEQLQKYHIEIFEKYLDVSNNRENEELLKRKLRLDLNQLELTTDEAEIVDHYQEFGDLFAKRKEYLVQLNDLKLQKKQLERKLVEADCQRVRCLGKDRLYNKYWWFENNGLPTLHGSNADEDDDEHSTVGDNDSSDDDVQEETYLMGRLWIQGPGMDDIKLHFKDQRFNDYHSDIISDGIEKVEVEDKSLTDYEGNPIKQLNYSAVLDEFKQLAFDKLGILFDANSIKKNDITIINQYGEFVENYHFENLQPIERKVIEESPDPLFNGANWRYYDKKEDIDTLIKWLNPYGVRESQLKKELINVKEAIYHSVESKSKALSNKENIDKRKKVGDQLSIIDDRIKRLESGEPVESDDEDSDVVEIKANRKRASRGKQNSNKRENKTYEELLKSGTVEELTEFKEELYERLRELAETRELSRALEWVNSTALDLFDKSLYDGGDKWKPKPKK